MRSVDGTHSAMAAFAAAHGYEASCLSCFQALQAKKNPTGALMMQINARRDDSANSQPPRAV